MDRESHISQLHKWGIYDFSFIDNDQFRYDGKTVNVNQDIDWNGKNLEVLPNLGIYRVHGNFDVKGNRLKTLENSPVEVTMHYDCSYNIIETLKGSGVQKVLKSFDCSHNRLKDLEGCPPVVLNKIYIKENALESLQGIGSSEGISTVTPGATGSPYLANESLKEEIEIYRACTSHVDGKILWNPVLTFIENLEILINADPKVLEQEWKLLEHLRSKYRGLDISVRLGIV